MSKITIASTHPLSQLLPGQLAMCLFTETHFRIFECQHAFRDVEDVLLKKRVDVLIASVRNTSHVQNIRNIIHANPNLKVVITGVSKREIIFEYIQLGVKGHFASDITETLLKRAIRVLHQGEVWFDREMSAKVLGLFIGQSMAANYTANNPILSGRETEVMDCVSRGMKNRDISKTLFITESTVKTHLYKIYEKLGVRDRMSAVLKMKEWSG